MLGRSRKVAILQDGAEKVGLVESAAGRPGGDSSSYPDTPLQRLLKRGIIFRSFLMRERVTRALQGISRSGGQKVFVKDIGDIEDSRLRRS